MKPILLSLLVFLVSCSPSKVCGGSGGKRSVDVSIKTNSKIIS